MKFQSLSALLVLSFILIASPTPEAEAKVQVRLAGRIGDLVLLDVASDKRFEIPAGGRVVVMLSASQATGSEIPLLRAGQDPIPAFCVGGANCQSHWTDTHFYAAALGADQKVRLGFSLQQLLAIPGVAHRKAPTVYVTVGVLLDETMANAKIDLGPNAHQPNAQLEMQAIELDLN